MTPDKVILPQARFQFTIKRLCHQLIENYDDFDNACIIGIQDRGALLSDRIHEVLSDKMGVKTEYGKLDISFYRDDYRRRDTVISPSANLIDFIIEDKKVILIDDVLYTGRTIQAALMALQQYGRPAEVELLVLVDRRFNRHLPIEANYKGLTVDALDEAYVKVEWEHQNGVDQVTLFSKKMDT